MTPIIASRTSALSRVPLIVIAVGVAADPANAETFVDLGGPATGFAAISNAKNSSTQAGIEGTNNGLPEYPNYQLANGNWTAVIAGPLSADSDYSGFASFPSGFTPATPGGPFVVNNKTITQPDFATLSAGRINFDNDLVTGSGIETVPTSALEIDLNTFAWDGNVTEAQTGDSRSNFDGDFASPESPVMISPFSPAYTPYNDGGGGGNAQFFYLMYADILPDSGAGLTFDDGELVGVDFESEVVVELYNIQAFPPDPNLPFDLFLTFTGTLSTLDDSDPLDYKFDVSGTGSAALFSNTNFLMNRSGTVSLIPEPAGLVLTAMGLLVMSSRRRRRTCCRGLPGSAVHSG